MENGLPEYVQNEATGELEVIHTPQTKEQAYDIARKEFYLIRQQEDIERRIAQEEARMVGAYFGKSRLEVSMELEDKTFESWKKWAEGETAQLEAQKASAYANFSAEENKRSLEELGLEEVEEEASASTSDGGN